MVKVSIVGCGTIGSAIAESLENSFSDKVELTALCDIDKRQADKLVEKLKKSPRILSLDALIEVSDLVVEAASGNVAAEVVRKCLENGKDVMVISIGGLIGQAHLFELAEKSKGRLYLPSGALCGIDAVRAVCETEIKIVELITRKPLEGLRGAPYFKEKGIDIDKIDKETVVFEGSAAEAIKGFPKNVNVSAILSIAGIGPEKTMVKIVTSPAYKKNSHQIIVEGAFGRLEARTDNVPSPQNPKTSYLAILSCISTLKQIFSHVKIGG
ncbi:MAG: aspartate dehydrogenase [Candidatus Omnitrophica bacterium]|nr:aspartate dehydrogenase [Candidatus Omnitrophota bacterium]